MPKTKIQKAQILRDLKEKMLKAKSVVFASFNGLAVKDSEALRRELRAQDSEYLVAKKTLLDLAAKEAELPELSSKNFTGQIAAVFGFGDEVAAAKTIDKFKKDHEGKIDFAGGILEGKLLSAREVGELAKLPGREELYAKIVGSINAPISGLVNVLAGNLRGLVTVLKAIGEKK